MRHEKVATIMDIYTHTHRLKGETQSKVVDVLFLRDRLKRIAS